MDRHCGRIVNHVRIMDGTAAVCAERNPSDESRSLGEILRRLGNPCGRNTSESTSQKTCCRFLSPLSAKYRQRNVRSPRRSLDRFCGRFWPDSFSEFRGALALRKLWCALSGEIRPDRSGIGKRADTLLHKNGCSNQRNSSLTAAAFIFYRRSKP